MGGSHEHSTICIRVGAPEHAPAVRDFLRRLDYGARLVTERRVEASPPTNWPESLARTALRHFIGAWNRAHPEQDVAIEGDDLRGRS